MNFRVWGWFSGSFIRPERCGLRGGKVPARVGDRKGSESAKSDCKSRVRGYGDPNHETGPVVVSGIS